MSEQAKQPFTRRQCFGKSPGKRAACVGCETRKQCEAIWKQCEAIWKQCEAI